MAEQQMNDHDLLIVLHEQVKGLRTDIQNLTDTTKSQVNDHEGRIRSLERRAWIMVGGLTILSFMTPYFWSLFHR